MNNASITITTTLAALVLAGLCTALPVYQWASIPQTTLLQILAGAAAFALSVCKLTFFPIAYANLETGRRLAAACLFASASVALLVSVPLALGALEFPTEATNLSTIAADTLGVMRSTALRSDPEPMVQTQFPVFNTDRIREQFLHPEGRPTELTIDLVKEEFFRTYVPYGSIIYRASLDRLQALTMFLLTDCCQGRPEICMPVVADLKRCCAPKESRRA